MAHVLAVVLLIGSVMPVAAADPGQPPPPVRSAPDPRNVDPIPPPSGTSPDAPAGQAAFAPIGGGAFIDNGVIELGVNPEGHLNVDGGPPSAETGATEVGLRWLFLNTDAISPGCLCEGWGAADATSQVSGWANGSWGIAPNLRVVSFQANGFAAESVVEILDPQNRPTLRVRHLYMPVPDNPFLYQALVSIENVSANSVDARYRRVMDWDVEPSAFNEYVTLVGDSAAEPWLAQMTNDGFANPDPLSPATDLGVRGPTQDYPSPDPAFDHGALFDLNFGTLATGRQVAFSIYYGVAGNEGEALAALDRVGVSVYSLGQTRTGQATGLPNTFMFGFGRPITCDQENFALDESRADAGSRPGLSEVIVKFDPRTLVDPRIGHWEQAADAVAKAIRVQAEQALDRYRAFGFDVSPSVTIEITCDLFFALPIGPLRAEPKTAGLVEADNKVKLRTKDIVADFRAAVLAWDPAAGPFVAPAGFWQQLVDHELFHTVQVHEKPIHLQTLLDLAAGDRTRIESTAVAAQDLDPDWDDKTLAQGSDYSTKSRSLLTERTVDKLITKSAIDAAEGGFGAPYEAGLIFQYWAERFAALQFPDLEQRAATFLRDLVRAPGVRTDAMRWALGGRDTYGALREFLIAAYVRDVPNVAAILPRYTFRDEVTGTDGQPRVTKLDPLFVADEFKDDLLAGPVLFDVETLKSGQGAIYEVALPAGTEQVRVDFTPAPNRFQTPVRLAFLRIDVGANRAMLNARIDPFLMTDGPLPGDSFQGLVPVAGAERLAIVVVASQTDATYDLGVQLANPDGVQILQPAPGGTIQIQPGVAASVGIEISPTVGNAVPKGLGPGAFSVTVGGQPAIVQNVRSLGDRYTLAVLVPGGLPAGSHDIVVRYESRSATRTGGITVAATAPAPPREISAADSFGTLAQGATTSATATVSSGTASAAFSIVWQGSDFDLTLRSPSGRVITESTVAGDVTITQGAATVEILVRTPEAGSWTLEVFGRVVPIGGEEVTYQVTEPNVPVRSELILPAAGSAGAPIDISLALGGLDGGLLDAVVIATVTDPAGITRRYPMTDVGTTNDGVGGDGIYGAAAWSTPTAGAYQVRVAASGVDSSDNAYGRVWTGQVTLGPKVDTDGDGLANAAEVRWNLDPADPADAAADLDGDGLTWLQEASASTDPFLPDTDGGRELDRTEVAGGRDPLDPSDDIAIPAAVVIAQPEDGRRVTLFVHTEGGVGTVVIDRLGPAGTVRLGTFPSSDAAITDGPLVAGTYRYRATVVLPGGAQGAPFEVGPIEVADDAVAPSAALVLNEGAWQTADRDVVARFVDLTEPVTSMRLALSEADLAASAWAPFDPIVDIRLAAALGPQRVYAQVRDAAGRESVVFSAVIDLTVVDDTPPVTSAGTLPAATSSPMVSVPFTASDVGTGTVAVELWQRERAAATDPWSPWHVVRSSDVSPIQVVLATDGNYEFYTIGIDNAGNRESPPAGADASTQLDRVAPQSSAGPVQASYSSPNAAIPFTATDSVSGVASVELWSRYRATAADTWGIWTIGPSGATSPLTFAFASGDGLYEFYTIAIDRAGNREVAPAVADASTRKQAADTTPPTSTAGPLNATYTSNTVTVPYTASDAASGVASVELWVRYRRNEAQAWAPYAMALARTSSPFTYTFASGDGNYEFYTVAVDNTGNREAPPTGADTATRRDAVDDPPDIGLMSWDAIKNGSTNVITLTGGGTAVDDRTAVTVNWQLYGVKPNGNRQRIFTFKNAVASDGAFGSRIEQFQFQDQRNDGGWVYYDIDIRVVAGTQSTTRTFRATILVCTPRPIPTCTG